MMPEHWNERAHRVVLTGEPPPEYSFAVQMVNMLQNMSVMGLYGACAHVGSKIEQDDNETYRKWMRILHHGR